MTELSKDWQRILFTSEQVLQLRVLDLTTKVKDIYEVLDSPADFCVLRQHEMDNEGNEFLVIYFSPQAVKKCKRLIASYSGEPCFKPTRGVAMDVVVGADTCLEQFS